MAALDVYMNGYRVGILTKTGSGAHHFSYDAKIMAGRAFLPSCRFYWAQLIRKGIAIAL